MIPVNGVELEVFEAGHENAGRPIVLLHGWPSTHFRGDTICAVRRGTT